MRVRLCVCVSVKNRSIFPPYTVTHSHCYMPAHIPSSRSAANRHCACKLDGCVFFNWSAGSERRVEPYKIEYSRTELNRMWMGETELRQNSRGKKTVRVCELTALALPDLAFCMCVPACFFCFITLYHESAIRTFLFTHVQHVHFAYSKYSVPVSSLCLNFTLNKPC